MAEEEDIPDPGTQVSPPTQHKEEKKWALSGGCSMKVASHGKKKSTDRHMVIDLIFSYEGDPFPKIVELPYTKESLANSLMICNTELEDFLKLKDCPTKDQHRNFEIFVNQAIGDYQETQRVHGPDRISRKTKQYHKPTIDEFDGQFFLIAGDVFLLDDPPTKLTEDQVKELPVNISWTGPKLTFKIDPSECYKLLIEVIYDMNEMQKNKNFVSFPIAVFSAHLMGQFYSQIIKVQGNFSTQVSISGPATSTGKSLMQTCCGLMFTGEVQPTMTSLTESTFYQILNEGRNIYVKDFSAKKQSYKSNAIDPKFLEMATKAIWERGSKEVRHVGGHRINGLVFIDANILPSDLVNVMDSATLDKIGFMYTGQEKLSHPDESAIVDRMLKNSKELFQHLPGLLSLGKRTLLEKVNREELLELQDVLKVKDERREGQRVATFDRLSRALKDAAVKFELPLPKVLKSEYIDRTSITYFNHSEEDMENAEQSAKQLLKELKPEKLNCLMEYCARSSTFKLKKSGLPKVSPSLRTNLGEMKTINSTIFKGQRGQRVIIFPESLLSQETIQDLKLLSCLYEEWAHRTSEERIYRTRMYGEKFERRVMAYRNHSITPGIDSQERDRNIADIEENENNNFTDTAKIVEPQEVTGASGEGRRTRHGGASSSRRGAGSGVSRGAGSGVSRGAGSSVSRGLARGKNKGFPVQFNIISQKKKHDRTDLHLNAANLSDEDV